MDQKTLAGRSPKWLRVGLETNTTNSLLLLAIGFGPFQIHDNWEPTINRHTFGGMTWKLLVPFSPKDSLAQTPQTSSLFSLFIFFANYGNFRMLFFQHSVGSWGVVVGPIMFNLINHSMTNTGMILDKYMQMIRIDMTWLRETCRDAQSKQKGGLKVSRNLKEKRSFFPKRFPTPWNAKNLRGVSRFRKELHWEQADLSSHQASAEFRKISGCGGERLAGA